MGARLTLSGVNLSFGGVDVLKDVGFDVEPGSILGLVGPNGAGKTSLFNCISGHYRPSSGSIRINGDEVLGKAPANLVRHGLARTFQHPALQLQASVLDNVLLGGHTRLPGDPLVWLAFAITQLLGHAVMFCFDWIVACAVFYSTESWGLAVARAGIATFFSGMLIPLAIMPDGLRTLAMVLPFSQVVYLPISVLSGLTALSELPRIWLIQLAYLAILLVLSRVIFRRATRVITVQGG